MPATAGPSSPSGNTTASTAAFTSSTISTPPSLRQNVQKALNRGEGYHQLRRAVSFASCGKLRFKTEYEQNLWSEASRLIANCIIFYNASILSRLLEYQQRTGDTQGAEATKKVSVVPKSGVVMRD